MSQYELTDTSFSYHSDMGQIGQLPSRPGIYKFQDKLGTVIYVGKAKNIKKRVLGHFRCKSVKESILCHKTCSIDFELTGSDLIALLLEADLIQKHLPNYNTVQKKLRTAYHIKAYSNKKGILQLAVEECPSIYTPTELFFTKGTAKKKLEKLCDEYNLCPKFMGLQRKKGRCKHAKFPFCTGVCCGEEEIHVYNQRAKRAITSLKAGSDSYIIHEKGRRFGEQSFVLVLEGVYQGFGYVDGSQQICGVEELLDLIEPRKHTYHTAQILDSYRKKNSWRVKVIETVM